VYKLVNGKENADYRQFFTKEVNSHGIGGHTEKLYVPGVRTNVRKNFFSQRVLPTWNGLPQNVIDAESVNSLKSRLDKHIKDMGL